MNTGYELAVGPFIQYMEELQEAKRVRRLQAARSNQPVQSWLSKLLRRAPRQAPAEIVEAISDITVAETPAKA